MPGLIFTFTFKVSLQCNIPHPNPSFTFYVGPGFHYAEKMGTYLQESPLYYF